PICFPESHAWSCALIAYATAYLKAHYPTEFFLGLLNAQPMGFYPVSTLVHDARRHGVLVRPPCLATGGRACTLAPCYPEPHPCHPERSEGSAFRAGAEEQILPFAQDDTLALRIGWRF